MAAPIAVTADDPPFSDISKEAGPPPLELLTDAAMKGPVLLLFLRGNW